MTFIFECNMCAHSAIQHIDEDTK